MSRNNRGRRMFGSISPAAPPLAPLFLLSAPLPLPLTSPKRKLPPRVALCRSSSGCVEKPLRGCTFASCANALVAVRGTQGHRSRRPHLQKKPTSGVHFSTLVVRCWWRDLVTSWLGDKLTRAPMFRYFTNNAEERPPVIAQRAAPSEASGHPCISV